VRGADQGAATASATRESQGAANAPRASVATATKAASAAAANASRTASGSAPAPVGGSAPQSSPSQPAPASTSSRDAAAQPGAAAASIPENAAVMFRCGGAPDVCASLRGAAGDALEKAGFRLVTTPDRADVAVGAIAGVLDQKVSREFGQTFNTRTYQIELTAEAPKLGDSISMPPATTVSFDSAVGRERLEEKSRLIAADLVERIRAFVKKKRGA
jgi:hypothetical protein